MAVPLPKIERALRVIEAQLATITEANGYHTDVGAKVYRARRTFEKGDLPAISVWKTGEIPAAKDRASRSVEQTCAISVDIHVKAGQADTGSAMELASADVKKALLSMDTAQGVRDADGELANLFYVGAEPSPRTDGANAEAMAVNFSMVVPESRIDPSK